MSPHCSSLSFVASKSSTRHLQLVCKMFDNGRRNILFALGKFSFALKVFQKQTTAYPIVISLPDTIYQNYFFTSKCPMVNQFRGFPLLLHMLGFIKKMTSLS